MYIRIRIAFHKLFEYLTIRISVFDATIPIIIKHFVLHENVNE
jgi:hypothetical protein